MQIDLVHLAVVIVILGAVYFWITRKNSYFLNNPIPFMTSIPIFGSTWPLVFRKTSFVDFLQTIYCKYSGVKAFRMFELTRPVVVIRDPDLIRQVSVKDFEYFMDRPAVAGSPDRDHSNLLMSKVLFFLTGQRWRNVRRTLTPSFSGNMMRQMFGLIVECCEDMIEYYKEESTVGGSREYEMKQVFSRLTSNVIAACMFGIKVDSLRRPNNEFYTKGVKIMDDGLSVTIRAIGHKLFPALMIYLGIDVIEGDVGSYFSSLVSTVLEEQSAKDIVRLNMINQMIQASNSVKVRAQRLSATEFVAQVLTFIGAGLDSVATCLQFMCYELALNPEIQDKLYKEVLEAHTSLEGRTLTYETLHKLEYLNMVVSESLRMWPPAPAVDRLCVKDYQLDDGKGLRFTVDKGTAVWFPIYALHHDEKYFPDPERFDPERFSGDRREDIKTGTYLPFGIGPRGCLGTRFALLQVKTIAYFVVLNFVLERTDKTEVPLVLAKGMNALPEILTQNGVYLRLKPRH